MSIKLHWFLTTAGDGRTIVGGSHGAKGRGTASSSREPDIDYLAQQPGGSHPRCCGRRRQWSGTSGV